MSAQAGIWNFSGEPINEKLMTDFCESLKQLGPDGESRYVKGAVAMLYRPFHTTADSRREQQPYISPSGSVVTLDGRIDNRQDLAMELRNRLDVDPTDVEIVAAAFDLWDTDCFHRIRGDWAVSIWKPEQRELFLAVDYMSIRHIFYYLRTSQIWWATDPAPLVLLSGDKFHVDDGYMAGYFTYDPDAHLTPYREIREVPAGHFVKIRGSRDIATRYWQPSAEHRIRYKTDADYEEHFRHIFRESVRCRLRSDSPILAELSGGLDSSSIVCIADDILSKGGVRTTPLDTLSNYDTTEPAGEDWTYFTALEKRRGRVGSHIDTSKLGTSPAPFECSDFAPFPGLIGTGRALEVERGNVVRHGGYRVVLSGIGGDEFMGGIPDPNAQLGDLILNLRVVRLARELVAWSLIKRKPCIQLLWEATLDLLPPSVGQYLSEEATVEPWLNKKFAKRTGLARRLLGPSENLGFFLPTRRSYAQAALLIANKMGKRLCRRPVLEEGRYPYLDQNLIEFVLAIPASQLLRPGERRSLQRRALAGIVPREILERRTKQLSARTPILAVGKSLNQLRTAFHSPLSSGLGYVDRDAFLTAVNGALDGRSIHIIHLMRTISFEFWLRDINSRGLLAVPDMSVPRIKAGSEVSRFLNRKPTTHHLC